MSWMIWVVAVLVMAMVIGPVAMMQPSQNDRRREALRARARQLGLHVALERLPERATDMSAPALTPVYGRKHKTDEAWLLRKSSYAHESHLADWWMWCDSRRPSDGALAALPALLVDLPERVEAIDCTGRALRVYWRESAQPGAVEAVSHWLDALAEVVPEVTPADSPQPPHDSAPTGSCHSRQ